MGIMSALINRITSRMSAVTVGAVLGLSPGICETTNSAEDSANWVIVYEEDFEKIEEGSLPDGYFALEGEFEVANLSDEIDPAAAGNAGKVLRMASEPLSDFVIVLGERFGPDIEVSVKVYAEKSGRRVPAFGVGAFGRSGLVAKVSAGQRKLDLRYFEQEITSTDFVWESGWTEVRLRVTANGDGESWRVQVKAWSAEQKEPEEWTLEHEITEEPLEGQISLWGIAYAGKPIYFDSIAVRKPAE